ncbi:hypothetical protein PCANC_09707 [Puccinia coronata f. sp. avenae]|uniref:Uncharacterized protein n=1 Tax=Puccinia coronata f. sp. avenae TaxID=200324 RepID=A0A2N5V7I3_9BASI|nr:hypothetical protein PCANC_09707 [Puccinia coronata f. sp. avenae]
MSQKFLTLTPNIPLVEEATESRLDMDQNLEINTAHRVSINRLEVYPRTLNVSWKAFLNEFNKVLERLTADEDVADKNNLSALGRQVMKILLRLFKGIARSKYHSDADEMGRDAAQSAMSLFTLRNGLLDANYPGEAGINLSLQQLGFSQETIRKIDQFISKEVKSEQSSTEIASDPASDKEFELTINNIQDVFQKHFAAFVKGPEKGGSTTQNSRSRDESALPPT